MTRRHKNTIYEYYTSQKRIINYTENPVIDHNNNFRLFFFTVV